MIEKIHAYRDASSSLVKLKLPLINGESASVDDLRQRFFESEFGIAMLEQIPRFSIRHLNAEHMIEDVGDDACPVGHQYGLVTYLDALLNSEIEAETLFSGLTDSEKAIVALACAVHDIGESTHQQLVELGLHPVGDIPAGNKTDEQRMREAEIRQYFYDTFLQDLPIHLLDFVESIVKHDDTGLLHELFEAAHELQSLDTTFYAERTLFDLTHNQSSQLTDERTKSLEAISTQTRANVRSRLENMRKFILVNAACEVTDSDSRTLKHTVTPDTAKYHDNCLRETPSVLKIAA